MTAILLLEKYQINDSITTIYPNNYTYNGKVAYIQENTLISIENLLEFLLIYSANDAAYIAALAVSNSVDEFIELMNEKAKTLNMINTNYVNPDGIDDENHYTTLNDLLKLSIETINNKQLLSIFSKSNFLSDATGEEKIFNNTNLLLDEGYTGIKTGWTDKAGLTFIGFNQKNKRQIITIVNKSNVDENKYNHFSDTKILYEISIDTFKSKILIDQDTNIYKIKNSYKTYNYKTKNIWEEFVNKNINKKLELQKYEINNISLKYDKFYKTYKINKSDTYINWQFNPIKLFKIFAND